jgi:hypothetical protein
LRHCTRVIWSEPAFAEPLWQKCHFSLTPYQLSWLITINQGIRTMQLQTGHSTPTQALADRMRASRTSINPLTFLATDFLNQFNEVAMTLDMLADWPDMIEELRGWQFFSYVDHFRRSGFADADTLIDAYWAAPLMIRRRFDDQVESLAYLTCAGLAALQHAWDTGPTPGVMEAAAALGSDIRTHVHKLASTINVGQPFETVVVDVEVSGMNQDDVDALFA